MNTWCKVWKVWGVGKFREKKKEKVSIVLEKRVLDVSGFNHIYLFIDTLI